jgi:ribosomal protein L13E
MAVSDCLSFWASRNDFNGQKPEEPDLSAPSRRKKVGGKKEAESKRIVKGKSSKPTGAPPTATVEVRHGGRMMQRQARGYSLGEVAQAGLNFGLARRWGLLVDDRRRSTLEDNVASLKKWSPQTKETAEERVESEVRKIEKAVKKEVRKAEKKIEKVGKEVGKEAKKAGKEVGKAEKEVVEKVEAPIKKGSKKKAATKSEAS